MPYYQTPATVRLQSFPFVGLAQYWVLLRRGELTHRRLSF